MVRKVNVAHRQQPILPSLRRLTPCTTLLGYRDGEIIQKEISLESVVFRAYVRANGPYLGVGDKGGVAIFSNEFAIFFFYTPGGVD